MSGINKVVLAYSGGLDTSVIASWLQQTYDCQVVTFTANIGQGEEVEPARTKAEAMGIKEIYIEDLREEFVRDFVNPMFRANALYEGEYLLGTSIARPLIAIRDQRLGNAVQFIRSGAQFRQVLPLQRHVERSAHNANTFGLIRREVKEFSQQRDGQLKRKTCTDIAAAIGDPRVQKPRHHLFDPRLPRLQARGA